MLKRSCSKLGGVGMGVCTAEVEVEEVQVSADQVHIKKRMHTPILIPRTLPIPQKAVPRGPPVMSSMVGPDQTFCRW
jgi:hypothetical protein